MEQAYEQLELSARSYHKVLCVARTIADLEGEKKISDHHLREALSYRMLQKKQRSRAL
jgi:magnesium chelatase family protein